MEPKHWGAQSSEYIKFPYLVFEAEAQVIFDDWQADLHRSRIPNEENPLIAQWLDKLDNLFLGLATIFHLINVADSQIPRPGESLAEAAQIPPRAGWVSLNAARLAKAWCGFLEEHARRIYAMIVSREFGAAQVLAGKVKGGKLGTEFTRYDVKRARWHGLTEASDIEAALGWLEEAGWVRFRSIGGTGPGSGRHTTKYQVNPRLSPSGP